MARTSGPPGHVGLDVGVEELVLREGLGQRLRGRGPRQVTNLTHADGKE
jgi:hypothetical protein